MLGVGVVAPEAIAQIPASQSQGPRDYSAWYCRLPFADYFSACQVPTLAELEAEHRRELSRVAAVNPELAQQGFERGQQLTAADCAANPERCAEFTFAGQNPTAAAVMGAGPVARTVYETASDFASVPTSWLVLGAAVVAALLLTRR